MRQCNTLILDRLDLTVAGGKKAVEDIDCSDARGSYTPTVVAELVIFMDDDGTLHILKNRYGKRGIYDERGSKPEPQVTASSPQDEEFGHRLLDFYAYGAEINSYRFQDLKNSTENVFSDPVLFAIAFPVPHEMGSSVASHVADFNRNETAVGRYRQHFLAALSDLGFGWSKNYGLPDAELKIVPSSDWKKKQDEWLYQDSGVFTQITRLLVSLAMFGFNDEAFALYNALQNLYVKHRAVIGPTVFSYWRKAIRTVSEK